MENILGKKYKLTSSQNFEEYLKEMGVNYILRKIASLQKPVFSITKNNSEYTYHFSSAFINYNVSFTPGIEFKYKTPDGRYVKSIIEIKNNTINEIQKNGIYTTITRIFQDNKLIVTFKVNDITCTRSYETVI